MPQQRRPRADQQRPPVHGASRAFPRTLSGSTPGSASSSKTATKTGTTITQGAHPANKYNNTVSASGSITRSNRSYVAKFGSGALHPVTKSAYPRFISSRLDVEVNRVSGPVPTRRRRTFRKAEDDLTTGSVRPSSMMRRGRTPPGGHFYEHDGKLYPVDAQIVDSGARREGTEHRQIQSEDPPRRPPRKQLALKAIRRVVHVPHFSSDSSESDAERDLSSSGLEYTDAEPEEQRREIIIISSDSESSDSSSAEHESLMRLFKALAPLLRSHVWHLYGRTPFLTRNLRAGFHQHCIDLGIPTYPSTTPDAPFQATYRFRLTDTDEWEDHVRASLEWICPLCDLHGKFNTRDMLVYHIEKDHSEVHHAWSEAPSGSGSNTWWSVLIQWTVSELPPTYAMRKLRRREDQGVDDIYDSIAEHPEGMNANESEHTTDLVTQRVGDISIGVTTKEAMPHLKCEETDNIPIPSPSTSQPSHTNIPPSSPRRPPRTGITPTGKLIPPPHNAKYGPAGEPPSESCRPGGPRIFDLLNELPMDPFGVLAWSITQREEEIFEHEDISDEDKVMLALWNRWILLNKEAFVFGDRYKQILVFLQEYYIMIHRAAGWNALRWFLLTLLANKFLTITQVVNMMKHYEKLVDMPNWYKDEE
ncbi:hypothetical protein BDY19DRAFT_1060135 [Irpex rosettiformis]|uniref:Uncharacterized protein n=1 Tax=Irpex rosettiformis TaxID=378272 RepID=A0ACB8TSC4_9APHY|nr:hypothetical protein BDY19DRAFT_1060135 [Irpex rosettiformis]